MKIATFWAVLATAVLICFPGCLPQAQQEKKPVEPKPEKEAVNTTSGDPFKLILASYTRKVEPEQEKERNVRSKKEIDYLLEIRKSLFKFEREAKEKIRKRLALLAETTYKDEYAKWDLRYKRIDMKFLSDCRRIERPRGISLIAPQFATFDIASASRSLSISVSVISSSVGNFTCVRTRTVLEEEHIKPYYEWLNRDEWINRDLVDSTFMLTAKFNGVIPDRVRKHINSVKDEFDSVYVVSEVTKWDIEQLRLNPDPLVIGRIDSVFWLIDKFDVTPAEDWVEKNYATQQTEEF